MILSVIIPTKNRLEDLLNTIRTVFIQTHLPNEIIIVDQNTSSEVKSAVMTLLNSSDIVARNNITIKYIHDPQITGLTQARNRAIGVNESDILLFLDDDVLLEKNFIFNILEIYRRYPDIYGVSGIITNAKTGLIGKIYYKIFWIGEFTDRRSLINTDPMYKKREYITVSKLPGGLTSYRKEVCQEFKFDENFIGYSLSEDFDFSFRVSQKYKIVITPKARLQHIYSTTGKMDCKNISKNTILSMYYFFRKNLRKNIYNYLCYIWWNIGCIIYGVLLAILRQQTDELIGYIKGFKELIKRKNSDFIQLKNN